MQRLIYKSHGNTRWIHRPNHTCAHNYCAISDVGLTQLSQLSICTTSSHCDSIINEQIGHYLKLTLQFIQLSELIQNSQYSVTSISRLIATIDEDI